MANYKLTEKGKLYKVTAGIAHIKNPKADPSVRHNEESHICVRAGDTVFSDVWLDEKHVGKFEMVQQVVTEVTPERRADVTKMIQTGQWTEDDREFLESLTEDGYQRVQLRAMLPKGKDFSALGEDVTSTFQVAFDEGYKVWKNEAGKLNVTKAPGQKPLNMNPLESKEIDKFVKQHVKENK